MFLLRPPYERIAPGYEFIKHITNQSPSLGLLHLAAEVRKHGYQPSIIESDIFDMTVEDVVAEVVKTRPAYVGITLVTVGVWCGAEIARKIKFALPDTVIIVGGPHISSMAGETMQRFAEFDYAVIGEGEEILVNLLTRLDAGESVDEVAGLVYIATLGTHPTIAPGAAPPHRQGYGPPAHARLGFVAGLPGAYRPALYDFPRRARGLHRGVPWLPLPLQIL